MNFKKLDKKYKRIGEYYYDPSKEKYYTLEWPGYLTEDESEAVLKYGSHIGDPDLVEVIPSEEEIREREKEDRLVTAQSKYGEDMQKELERRYGKNARLSDRCRDEFVKDFEKNHPRPCKEESRIDKLVREKLEWEKLESKWKNPGWPAYKY